MNRLGTVAVVGLLFVVIAGPLTAMTTPAAYTVGIDSGFPRMDAEELSPDTRQLVESTDGRARNITDSAYPSAFPKPSDDEDREQFFVTLDDRLYVVTAEWRRAGGYRIGVADRTESVLLDRSELSPAGRAVIDRARAAGGSAPVYGSRPSDFTDGVTPDSLAYLTTELFVVRDGESYRTVSVTEPLLELSPVGHWLATLGLYLGSVALVPAATRTVSRRFGLGAGWLAGVGVVFLPVALADPAVADGIPLDTVTVARLTERLPVVAGVALLAGTVGAWRFGR